MNIISLIPVYALAYILSKLGPLADLVSISSDYSEIVPVV